MKELYIQYSYSYEQWGVYDPDIEEFIHYHPSIKEVVTYAYELASLIKPCQVNLIPQYLLTSYTICCCY
ncbi:hypothetical protein [Turicibacter sp. TJ11]|uniref:hypothetical protein n=1 Tax=Turicibacter sp. TJ11 TaxID=2806443 RepID=UPI001F3E4EF9|nr:hypothetical protein [Turicibacter sp. TJ11]